MEECILDAVFIKRALLIMDSDMVPEPGLIKGNAVSLSLDCNAEKKITVCYEKLFVSIQVTHLLKDTFRSAWCGSLTDKVVNHSLLYFDKR